MAIFYVDFENGNDANAGTSFATRKKTISSAVNAGSGWASGDVVRVMASPPPTSLGVNGTFTKDSEIITLSAAVNKTIDLCDSGWVAATNITVAHSTTNRRQGSASVQITPASAFTTGLMAYKDLGSSQDFSAYQQVCFWVVSALTRAAGFFTLRLCSDAAGATVVNTINMPALTANVWQKVVVDHGSTLGNSIRSVSVAATSDPGTSLLRVDDIFAAKAPGSADELTLFTLISTNNNSPDGDPWLSVGSVDETTITLNGAADGSLALPGTARYRLPTETTLVYVRQPIFLSAAESANKLPSGGGYGTVEGGWNRTDMSTKIDKTFIRRANGSGQNVLTAAAGRVILHSFGVCDANVAGWGMGGDNTGPSPVIMRDSIAIGCRNGFYYNDCDGSYVDNVEAYQCEFAIVVDGTSAGYKAAFPTMRNDFKELWGTGTSSSAAIYNASNTINEYFAEYEYSGDVIYSFGNGYLAINGGGQFKTTIINAVFSQTTNCINHYGEMYLWKTTHDSVSAPLTASMGNVGLLHANQIVDAGAASTIPSLYYNDRFKSAVVQRSTALRRTASGYSWQHNIGSETLVYEQSSFTLAQIACPANEARTVKVYAHRANAEGIARIRIEGGLYNGVPDDLTDELSTTGSWELLTLTFTPTENVVVSVLMESKWVSDAGTRKLIYFDDLEVT